MPSRNAENKRPAGLDTVYSSELLVDPNLATEWIAAQWQGAVPAGLLLHSWVVLQNPWRIRLVWEAYDEEAMEFVEQRVGNFGKFETEVARDAGPGGTAYTFFAQRDGAGFGQWLKDLGMPDEQIAYQVALRQRAADAPDLATALAIARDIGVYDNPALPEPR